MYWRKSLPLFKGRGGGIRFHLQVINFQPKLHGVISENIVLFTCTLAVKYWIWWAPKNISLRRIVRHRQNDRKEPGFANRFHMSPGRCTCVENSVKRKNVPFKVVCGLALPVDYVCKHFCQYGNICVCNLIILCRWHIPPLPLLFCNSYCIHVCV